MLIKPKTKSGKWTVSFICSFIIFLAALQLLIALGQRGGETFFSNPYLAFSGLLAALSGVAGFFVGLFAVISKKERTVLVWLSIVIGLFVTLFVSAEILFPH